MCTLSLVRDSPADIAATRPAWRVVFNRDERRSRAPGEPPRQATYDGVRVLHPIDPDGGGTWIAASEHGLVFALLNEHETAVSGLAPPARLESRGRVIGTLAASRARRARDVSFDLIDTLRVRPFRLVVADADEILEVCGRDGALSPVEIDRSRCLMRTSSSVEPGPVAASRARLFETVRSNPSWPAQDAFHAMTDPDRPGFGVSMSRADACTVSMTSVEVFADRVRMAYLPRPGHAPAHVTDLARATY